MSGAHTVDSLASELDRRRLPCRRRHRANARRFVAARAHHRSTWRPMCPGLQGASSTCRHARWSSWRGARSTACRLRDQLRRRQPDRHREGCHSYAADVGRGSLVDRRGPVHIAIPTTLSAGEFTAVVGITEEQTRVKRAVSDPRLVPRTVYTDPTVTLETPAWLWAASGVRALDHAVETIYSARHHPLSDAAAARGLSLLVEHLPPSLSTSGAEQLEHRLQCQLGAWLSVFG